MHREVATSAQCVYSRRVIPQEPLPEGWIPERDLSYEEGDKLDEILFRGEAPPVGARARWSVIKNERTGERAWLRMHGGTTAAVTGLVFVPEQQNTRIINRSVRSIPLAAIELASQEENLRLRRQLEQDLFHRQEDWKPSLPLGSPREVEDFHHRVALQFLDLKQRGFSRPVAQMAEINQRPLKTVQGWVTDARKKGLLPPGKRGRAG